MEAPGLARLHLEPCYGMAASHALAALPGGAELSRSRMRHCVSIILRSLGDVPVPGDLPLAAPAVSSRDSNGQRDSCPMTTVLGAGGSERSWRARCQGSGAVTGSSSRKENPALPLGLCKCYAVPTDARALPASVRALAACNSIPCTGEGLSLFGGFCSRACALQAYAAEL